ncbi:MAG: hypothetical protein LRY55_12880 [Leadbetterella sp.]|nr:hypothetical protein [Leadbetterella sp.]
MNGLSVINEPFLSVPAFGLAGALVIAFTFIFLISHEILAVLYSLVSQNSEKGKNSLPQVLVVTAVFLVNAVLIYLENARRIDKSSFVIPPLLLYILSLIPGLWGFRKLSDQRGWFSFRGVGRLDLPGDGAGHYRRARHGLCHHQYPPDGAAGRFYQYRISIGRV